MTAEQASFLTHFIIALVAVAFSAPFNVWWGYQRGHRRGFEEALRLADEERAREKAYEKRIAQAGATGARGREARIMRERGLMRRVSDAWNVPGIRPDVHEQHQTRLRATWPTLAKALDALPTIERNEKP